MHALFGFKMEEKSVEGVGDWLLGEGFKNEIVDSFIGMTCFNLDS